MKTYRLKSHTAFLSRVFWTTRRKLPPSRETSIIRTMKRGKFDWFTNESQQNTFNQEFDVTLNLTAWALKAFSEEIIPWSRKSRSLALQRPV